MEKTNSIDQFATYAKAERKLAKLLQQREALGTYIIHCINLSTLVPYPIYYYYLTIFIIAIV